MTKDFAFRGSIIKRADKAADKASSWHQGSGVQADAAAELTRHHFKEAAKTKSPDHLVAAVKWSKAAEAEAKGLEKTKGEWTSKREWNKSPSGKADRDATRVSKKTGVDPEDFK